MRSKSAAVFLRKKVSNGAVQETRSSGVKREVEKRRRSGKQRGVRSENGHFEAIAFASIRKPSAEPAPLGIRGDN